MLNYLILDVDGTLTDGGVYYDDIGNELKKFCTKDGTGIILSKSVGITLLVLTGRECKATTRRMTELGIRELYQGVKDKVAWIRNWMDQNGIVKEDVGYIGDDVDDLGPMKLCGFVACPADAVEEVKEIADYVSNVIGGAGVVGDVIKYLLKAEGRWEEALNKVYGAGV